MVKIDYTLFCNIPKAQPISLTPPASPIVPVAKDTIRSAANAGDADCFEQIVNFFGRIWAMITRLFSRETIPESSTKNNPIDPAQLQRWGQVVLKSHPDSLVCTHFINAAAKMGIEPRFPRIVFSSARMGGSARLIFAGDGTHGSLTQRGINGEFNNPETLIVIVNRKWEPLSENDKQRCIEHIIEVHERDVGHPNPVPLERATFFVINLREQDQIEDEGMPERLFEFLKNRT